MKPYIFIAAAALLASCGIYNSHFDCPAGKGIGCKSVNEVLDLIVEKEEGEDVFVADPGQALLLKDQEKKKHKTRRPDPLTEEEKKKLYLLKEKSGEPVLIQATEKAKS